MHNVLASIVNHKREILGNIPVYNEVPLSTRSFADALSKPQFSYILECKQASPSKGLIRECFDIEEIISVYDQKADAISILTEERFFRGSFQYLKQARELTNKPLLCKDFILAPKQVLQARYFGADAILLMMSVLTDFEYANCASQAQKLNMDILTEVHDEQELQRALNLGAKIIGINNRNLKDLSISLANTEKLSKLIPKGVIVVTESGISGHQDVQRLAPFSDACLVGSHLMSSDSLESQVNELVFGDIKICGVTNAKDFELLLDKPCNSLGLILTENSKRYTAKCFYSTKPKEKQLVGVFQNQTHELILEKIKEFKLHKVQLHGQEDLEYIKKLKSSLPPNITLAKSLTPEQILNLQDLSRVDEYLIDTVVNDQAGGTGQVFDWQLLLKLPIEARRKLRIAGGLKASNIQKLKSLGISKIDICSGSEKSYGIKSASKLNQIFESCRVLARQTETTFVSTSPIN